jgi:hypothetical protein
LSSIYSGGIYDYKNKKYIENDSEQIKLFSINNKELNYIDIQLSKFTYNLLLNNINYLNNIYIENNINKTRNILSRRIYYLVSLWKCGSDILITDLYTLSKYIPAIDLEEKFKKREIIDALENLDSNKIININYKDRDNIIFNFKVGA